MKGHAESPHNPTGCHKAAKVVGGRSHLTAAAVADGPAPSRHCAHMDVAQVDRRGLTEGTGE